MALFTLHALFYVIGWSMQGILVHKLLEWNNTEIANLPGVISLLAGLLMWVTSLPGLRKSNFELFFYTHQLYVVFVIFLVLHVGHFIFSIASAGIFLFMLDRFLRFCQSRRTVNVLSARCFPCGTVELVISKPPNLHYNALGWVFLQVREQSWLQWHPFSVSSSPLDGRHHVAILIKVLGEWTAQLKRHILSISEEEEPQVKTPLPPRRSIITASIEGPYGHKLTYYLMYENLVLVAGGIGISPFLAILRDILHRVNDNKPCLPRNILLVWAVKKLDEFPLLKTVNMESICPHFSDKLNLKIQTYVTQELEPSLEEGIDQTGVVQSSLLESSKNCGMSVLAGTGNIVWSGTYVMVSITGLLMCVLSLYNFYIYPYNVSYWWYKGVLLLACMSASVLIFGGAVIGLWHHCEQKTSVKDNYKDVQKNTTMQQKESGGLKISSQDHFVSAVKYGKRPCFPEIFGSVAELWGNVDVGVIVCGPPMLQTSVAKECRGRNLGGRGGRPVFHFHSHRFDL